MTTIPASGYLGDDTRTQAEFQTGIELLRDVVAENQLKSNRNLLINGCFRIWQRGTSFSGISSGSLSADRWIHRRDGSGATINITREAFVLGQTDVPNNPKYYLKFDQTVAGSGATYTTINQRIESVQILSDGNARVSFYGKADSTRTVGINLRQYFGTGGSPSSTVTLTSSVTFTSSWELHEATFSLGSLSGKTLGSNGDDRLEMFLTFELNRTQTYYIANTQVEKGAITTEFERRFLGYELALCHRYYWKGYLAGRGYSYNYAAASDANMALGAVFFPVTMRTTPTVAIETAPTYDNCSHSDLVGGPDGFTHRADVTATGRFRGYDGVYSADAEL